MPTLEECFLEKLECAYGNFNDHYNSDNVAIAAIAGGRTAKNADDLKAWLTSYKVFQSYSMKRRNSVVRAIFRTVAAHPEIRSISSEPDLRRAYMLLYRAIAFAAPRCGGEKNEYRDVTSLTAKALWCCSPGFVPIFDSHVATSLYVLGRLHDLKPQVHQKDVFKPYFEFCDLWFGLANKIDARKIFRTEFDARGWRHNAPPPQQAFTRSFDKFLWIMGQPKFG
jgi:hypothetical protein